MFRRLYVVIIKYKDAKFDSGIYTIVICENQSTP